MRRRLIIWLPLAIFAGFLAMFAARLSHPGDNIIASKMIGKAMPDFALKPAVPGHAGLAAADLRDGRPHLVNVFASWCVPCKAEAPQLAALKRRGIPVQGIAIRDRSEDVASFLSDFGDPFDRIGADPESRVQFLLGSSGVPETYVIDGKGVIRHQHIGAIMDQDMATLLAEWEKAK
jgi:cytochrome c biogenesis protein CcmG/thiol:disulfide interchange protein DsbE